MGKQHQVTVDTTCHPAAAKAWNGRRHAHAWESLELEQRVAVELFIMRHVIMDWSVRVNER